MQLESIALYSHDGRRRELPFGLGQLNVISGVSRTGKTELIKIIDYCAGRKKPRLAPGPLTRRVAWFAAVFVAPNGRRVMIARPQPTGKSSTQAMVEFGASTGLPNPDDLSPNGTNETVRGALDDLLGLGRFDVEEYTGVRERLRASVSHAIQFCLQAQTELISPEHLFHRGGDPEVAKDFRTLFPYFVGAVDEELLLTRRRAIELRRQLRNAEERLGAIQARRTQTTEREKTLLERAAEAGLLTDVDTSLSPREQLRAALTSTPVGDLPADDQSEMIAGLRREVDLARSTVRGLREERAALRVLDANRGDHRDHLQVQAGRLGIVGGLESDGGDTASCPVCGAPLTEPDPTAAELARDAAQVAAQLAANETTGRDIVPAERILDDRLATATVELERLRSRLEEAVQTNHATRDLTRAAEQRARLRGVIEEYLRNAGDATDAAEVDAAERIRGLKDELAAVEPDTNNAVINEEIEARLGAMSEDMTNWARRLELESADEGVVAIDRRTLNVAIRTPRGSIGLEEMGSAENHVGYHLVAHLALHRHFARESRPVPRFVFFDQPSLPYFPKGLRVLDEGVNDVDWDAVKHMFMLADEVAQHLEGALQVIITDHAMFAGEKWFDDALVEDWHEGTKLVPDDWPER